MPAVTATVVTALDVAAQYANDAMLAALADLEGLRRDMLPEDLDALEADAFATYLRTMDLLELDPAAAFPAERWAQFEATAATRTRRNALAARRRADSLWGARTAIAATVAGVALADILAGRRRRGLGPPRGPRRRRPALAAAARNTWGDGRARARARARPRPAVPATRPTAPEYPTERTASM